jgi:hypothetical protein
MYVRLVPANVPLLGRKEGRGTACMQGQSERDQEQDGVVQAVRDLFVFICSVGWEKAGTVRIETRNPPNRRGRASRTSSTSAATRDNSILG